MTNSKFEFEALKLAGWLHVSYRNQFRFQSGKRLRQIHISPPIRNLIVRSKIVRFYPFCKLYQKRRTILSPYKLCYLL